MVKTVKTHTSPQAPAPPADTRRSESREEDSRLIHRALGGEERAFRRLRQKYQDAIQSLIYRMVRNPEEVQDLTQEAFIKAFASLADFNDEYAFSTWLYRIATNNCIDHLRKKKLQTFSIDKPIESKDSDYAFELPDTNLGPDQELIASQRRRMLDEAMRSLPPKYRQVILMRHVEEKEYSEIARILKLPLGTVKAHIFRAREMLYKQLRDKIRHY